MQIFGKTLAVSVPGLRGSCFSVVGVVKALKRLGSFSRFAHLRAGSGRLAASGRARLLSDGLGSSSRLEFSLSQAAVAEWEVNASCSGWCLRCQWRLYSSSCDGVLAAAENEHRLCRPMSLSFRAIATLAMNSSNADAYRAIKKHTLFQ